MMCRRSVRWERVLTRVCGIYDGSTL